MNLLFYGVPGSGKTELAKLLGPACDARVIFAGEITQDKDEPGRNYLMRLALVAIRYWNDRTALRDIAARRSRVTHAAPEAVDACVYWAELLADAIQGERRSLVFSPRGEQYAGRVSQVAQGSWRSMRREAIRSGGYVEASLWYCSRAVDFREAVLAAASLGHDAGTTAAITGQLAGSLFGYSSIPETYRERLAWHVVLLDQADRLFETSLAAADRAALQ